MGSRFRGNDSRHCGDGEGLRALPRRVDVGPDRAHLALARRRGGGAPALASLLVVGETARHRRVRNGEVVAVAGAHAQRPVGARGRRVRHRHGREAAAAEQVLEEAAAPAAGGVLAILRAAIILAECHQEGAALALALAAVALQPLDLTQGAVEIRAHLLDLIDDRTALRRLSTEQGEEPAALATQALRLLAEPIELGLLLGGRVLVALDLLGLGGIDADAAVERGELAFVSHANLAARGSAWRLRGWRVAVLRRRRHAAKDEN